MSTTQKALETLGRLAVQMNDSRLANRIDDNMSRSDFHAYLDGVDAARAEARELIEAIQDMALESNTTLNRLDSMATPAACIETAGSVDMSVSAILSVVKGL